MKDRRYHRIKSYLLSSAAFVPVIGIFTTLTPSAALAACDPTGTPGVWICSGEVTNTTEINSTGDVSISTQPGFDLDVGSGEALAVNGRGSIRFVDENESTIHGSSDAIHTINDVSEVSVGDIQTEITVFEVRSDSRMGIESKNTTSSGNSSILIDAGIASGYWQAISASNTTAKMGNILTDIRVSKAISTGNWGIENYNSTSTGNISAQIHAESVQALWDGIYVKNEVKIKGDVETEVTASDVSSQKAWGIYVENITIDSNTLAAIDAGTVVGGYGAIAVGGSIQAKGDATTRIKAGAVQGKTVGIVVEKLVDTGNVSTRIDVSNATSSKYGVVSSSFTKTGRFDTVIKAGSVTALDNAIAVSGEVQTNLGEHSTISITTTGAIHSSDETGIYVDSNDADTSVTISGLVHGGNGQAILVERDKKHGLAATLELQSGYKLEGAALALLAIESSSPQLDLENSHLVLGGDGDASFDLSWIDNRDEAIHDGDANRITGFGTLTKSGNSIWALTGSNDAFAADAFLYGNIEAGILTLDNASLHMTQADSSPQTTGKLTIAEAGNLSAIGASTLEGSLINSGAIILANHYNGGNGALAGDKLNISGNYDSNNGLLYLDTVLDDDSSATDTLIIEGDTSGTTFVRVTNAGGEGAQTVEGIRIIEIGGISGGAFSLIGDYETLDGEQALVAGAYSYTLEKNGIATPDDGNWYLRSTPETDGPEEPEEPRFQAGAPIYEAYPQALLGLNGLPTLQQRVGNRLWTGNANRVIARGADAIGTPFVSPEEAGTAFEGNGIWGRIVGAHSQAEAHVTTVGVDYDQNIFKMQAGADFMALENDAGRLIGGLSVHYVHGRANTQSPHDAHLGGGRISTDGYGLAGTLTWYGDNGVYVDAQGQVTWYDSELSFAGGNRSLAKGIDGFGHALSLEGGRRIALDPAWSLTPQAQLTWSRVSFDDFHDIWDTDVSLDRGESLQGRLGLSLDYGNSWQNTKGMMDRAHAYGIANFYYEFLDGTRVDVAGASFANRAERLWGGVGLGGAYNWDDDKYSIYGEGQIDTSLNNFGNSYSIKGQVGLRVKW